MTEVTPGSVGTATGAVVVVVLGGTAGAVVTGAGAWTTDGVTGAGVTTEIGGDAGTGTCVVPTVVGVLVTTGATTDALWTTAVTWSSAGDLDAEAIPPMPSAPAHRVAMPIATVMMRFIMLPFVCW
ncbi:MAG: hypothetical protein IVW52_18885 [Acidimicrobiales bacterium]|nr:hypothetical protein [Acidimicrobiales bacterium]